MKRYLILATIAFFYSAFLVNPQEPIKGLRGDWVGYDGQSVTKITFHDTGLYSRYHEDGRVERGIWRAIYSTEQYDVAQNYSNGECVLIINVFDQRGLVYNNDDAFWYIDDAGNKQRFLKLK